MNSATEEPASPDANPGENPVKEAKDRYFKSISNRSETVVGHVIEEFIDELHITSFDQIDKDLCRDYCEYLADEVDDPKRDLSPRTTYTYFDYVRAFLSFCVRDGHLDTNPAKRNGVDEFLPSIEERPDQQFWTPEQRTVAMRFCREQIDSALQDPIVPGDIKRERYRLYAIVTLLSLSAVRGAEVFAVTDDDRRDGLTWDDVDFGGNVLNVLGKVKHGNENPFQEVPLPETAADVLRRYKRVSDPPSDAWPLFPTNHYPSKKDALADEIGKARTDRLATPDTIDALLREHEAVPPSLTTNGARSVLQRFTKRLEPLYECIEFDEEENIYLKPHGARRGLGAELYRKGHAEKAQKSLRHGSVAVTDQSYQNITAGETAEDIEEIIDTE